MESSSGVFNRIKNTFINKVKIKFYNMKSKIKQTVNRIDSNLLSNNNHINEFGFEDLTPKGNVDKSNTYCKSIDWALKNENVRNIALSGPYGAGKSSILKTYRNKHNEYKYLNISLACFTENADEDDNILEKAILQQMFYKVKDKKIPYSRFKRIKIMKNKTVLYITFLILCAVLSGTFLFKPEYKEVIIKEFFAVQNILNINQIQVEILIAVFVVSTLIIGKKIINYSDINFKISKIKLKFHDQEAEIGKEEDKSIFNKYIDEILYFFEANKYDVIIFEDLDRFGRIEIFSKLRELNGLINNSEQINRRIVFIYAIKDDIFSNKDSEDNVEHSKNRTKFFDFIIPVIPIINSSNSYDMLIKKLDNSKYWNYDKENKKIKLLRNSEMWRELDVKFIGNITILINDMRILNNIYNEFVMYIESLSEGEVKRDLNKLLAIIIYKNIYPTDFAKLQIDQGMVYKVFSSETRESIINEIETKCTDLRKKIETNEREIIVEISELRTLTLAPLMKKTNFDYILINDIAYHIDDLIKEKEKFDEFLDCDNYKIQEVYSYSSAEWKKLPKNDMEYISEKKENYKEREKKIQLKEANEIKDLKKQLDILMQDKIEINSLSVKELINKEKFDNIFNEEIKNEKLLRFLIKNGYIDEEYSLYTTYFHEGSLTKTDRDFITNILYEEELDASEIIFKQFEYKLFKKEEIIGQLRENHFKKEFILNYDLLNYIIEKIYTEKKYKHYYDLILEQLSNGTEKTILFIENYLYNSDYEEHWVMLEEDNYVLAKYFFLKSLYAKWQNMWKVLVSNPLFSEEDLDSYLVDIIEMAELDEIERMNIDFVLSNSIANKPDFLSLGFKNNKENIIKILEVLERLNVKFSYINKPSEKLELKLFEYIYEKRLYKINNDMIKLIIELYSDTDREPENLEKYNYTMIKQSKCKYLIDYIEDNINEYIENVFLKLENNIYETEESIICLINKCPEILGLENKKIILEKEIKKINNITDIEENYWNIVVESSSISSRWENIIEYYKKFEKLDENLIKFLNKKENYISLSSFSIEESDNYDERIVETMIKEIIQCEKIEEEGFRELADSMPNAYSELDMENLSVERVNNIVDCRLLQLTTDNFNLIKEKTKNKHIQLIINRFDDYLKDHGEYELDSKDIKELINSTITLSEKISIIKNTDISLFSNENGLMDDVIAIILKQQSHDIKLDNILVEILLEHKYYKNLSDDMINYIMDSWILIINKVRLLSKLSNYLSEEEIFKQINKLGDPYSQITEYGKKPAIEYSEDNIDLLKSLEAKKYISSWNIEDKSLRVNTKRRK
ncbi:hypothetical protein [Clostridium beijerinckii]|uniref:YobI family P-loop NTPase n=1 Tax=Clostridium beijerinckii TaxID=1520 RepID=UPI00242CB3C3|nr:hypothetical protein [Clostridium beijerinckii]MDG5853124.1 hypothetical protein [Clostridium beijerinckii]